MLNPCLYVDILHPLTEQRTLQEVYGFHDEECHEAEDVEERLG